MLLCWLVSSLTCFFSSSPNQLGKVNELLIKHDLSDLVEEKKEEDVVEECVKEETGFKADCVFTAENLEAALNLVMFSSVSGGFKKRKIDSLVYK